MPLIPLIALSAWQIVGGVTAVGVSGLTLWGGIKGFNALQMRKFRKILTEGGENGAKDLEDYFLMKGHAFDREQAERLVGAVAENIQIRAQQAQEAGAQAQAA